MPDSNQIHLRGEIAEPPYFDQVRDHQHSKNGNGPAPERIAFWRAMVDVYRQPGAQAISQDHRADRLRVVAYGKLAEAMRDKAQQGDWIVVSGWLQVRNRPAEHDTVTDVMAIKIDHFMTPLVPGSSEMERVRAIARERGLPVRDLYRRLVVRMLEMAEREQERSNVEQS